MAARRGPANTRSSYKRYRRYKKAHLCSSRSALLVASSSTGFIINEPKQVLSLSFSQIDQLPGGEKMKSLTDPDSGKKRKDRLTDVTKHASI
jgi:hypothetical protein